MNPPFLLYAATPPLQVAFSFIIFIIIDTFVENYDLSGKTIVPFATSGGSGMGKTVDVLSKLSPNAKWQTGKMVNGISEKEIKNWVSNL